MKKKSKKNLSFSYPSTELSPAKKKTALVTGGSKRIGKEITKMLAGRGWQVAIHYHQSEFEAQKLQEELHANGNKTSIFSCDLSNTEQTDNLILRCKAELGPLSLLINNASLFKYDTVDSLDKQLWQKTIDVNLTAPIQLAKKFLEQLPQNEKGCVINLLDQKVFNLNPDFFSYTVSKQALECATRTLALALAPRIRVCGVAPGITLVSGKQTPENFSIAHTKAPLGKSSEVIDIVKAIEYLVSAPALTGVTIPVDGGQHLWPIKRDVQFEE